ncbi:hypothetical protein TNCV_2128871 [Trichonephila clavipes]|nr:hypothetical protein TNCV_2128871 [Trichonephila clavipes]
MKSKHHRFVLLRRIFEPWQWKRRKKRNRFEQTSRNSTEENIECVQPKDQLILLWLSMEIPLRTAYGQNGRCGMQPKPSSPARRRIKVKAELKLQKERLLRKPDI